MFSHYSNEMLSLLSDTEIAAPITKPNKSERNKGNLGRRSMEYVSCKKQQQKNYYLHSGRTMNHHLGVLCENEGKNQRRKSICWLGGWPNPIGQPKSMHFIAIFINPVGQGPRIAAYVYKSINKHCNCNGHKLHVLYDKYIIITKIT